MIPIFLYDVFLFEADYKDSYVHLSVKKQMSDSGRVEKDRSSGPLSALPSLPDVIVKAKSALGSPIESKPKESPKVGSTHIL